MAKKWKAKLTPNQFRNKYFKKKIYLPLIRGSEYFTKSCITCEYYQTEVCENCRDFNKYKKCSYKKYQERIKK